MVNYKSIGSIYIVFLSFFAYADIPSLDSPTHMKGKHEVLLIIVYAAIIVIKIVLIAHIW